MTDDNPTLPDTMTALIGGRGPDWELSDVPVPSPGSGQVLVRNRAAATNNADLPMLADADTEYIAGFEFAGEIAAVGADTGDWSVGDPVMGTVPTCFAEYVLADHRYVQPRPADMDPAVACALPTALVTEFGALQVAGFHAGQTVLITGATSGIGLVGVQVAKALGASTVIATTRTADRRALLEDAGADVVVVTGEENLTEAVLAATGDEGVEVVLDHVGGQTFADCLPATAQDGHVVNIGRLGGAESTVNLDALSYRHLTVNGVSFNFTRDEEMAGVVAGLLADIQPAVARGEVRPVIDATFAAADHRSAAERLRSGSAAGKVVLTF